MITVTIAPDELHVAGHAGAGPPGHDIVCAAVSVLVQTLAASIEAFTKDVTCIRMYPGEAIINWRETPSKELALLIDSCFLGLCEIAEANPMYITVTGTR